MNHDLSLYKKSTDIMSLMRVLNSGVSECNVILNLKNNVDLDFIQVRSNIIGGLVTATIALHDLIKLENSPEVISYNVAKQLQSF